MDKVTTIRLWTYQSCAFAELIQTHERVFPQWQPMAREIRLAFEWMLLRLPASSKNGIDSPPLWAWYKFSADENPSCEAGKLLLSDAEIESGVVLLEFEAPRDLVVLSCYEMWNAFLDMIMESGQLPLQTQCWEQMFASRVVMRSESVQGVLPYFEREWLRNVRKYGED
jgi:hypothetical protein